ncbi:CBS domain-containing protein [Halopseudomonas salegens]|uniref:CBS domain-containing protein n=1 Tax=Halopseudomonas salegens TaxID=1434072 RepID=A0A1H2GJK6_9GAMM|nr:CBS domain-containing protein [Halopseudomonas salegens]SDU19591.1 CBS domain-containing protein [Halopseudomonas salegens]
MQVKDVMTGKPEYLDANASILEASQRMRDNQRGFTPVADKGKIVGVVTDRDIAVRAVAEGKSPNESVSSILSSKVLYCFQDDDVKTVLQSMQNNGVQRFVVLNNDKNKDFVGVVTVGDIADKCEGSDMAQRIANASRHYH